MTARLMASSGGASPCPGAQPARDGIGIARLEQALACHRIGALPGGDRQPGGGPLAPGGAAIMIAERDPFRRLRLGAKEGASVQERLLSPARCRSCYQYRGKLLRFINLCHRGFSLELHNFYQVCQLCFPILFSRHRYFLPGAGDAEQLMQ